MMKTIKIQKMIFTVILTTISCLVMSQQNVRLVLNEANQETNVPRGISNEYAKHGLPANQFQNLFDNLVEKGYELDWLDGYSVGGKAYLNVLFSPKTGKPWKAYFGLSSSAYQTKFNEAKQQGLQPVFVDTYTLNNSVKYNVIFKKVSGSYLARHGLSYNEHKEVMNEAKSKKLRPTCVAVAPVNGKRQYTVLYRSNPIGSWVIKSRVLEKDYQKLFNQQKEAGRSPMYLNAYKLGSKVYLSTIFASNIPGAFKARHGMSGSSYQDQWESATDSGYRTKVVTAFDNASSQHRFAAVWRKTGSSSGGASGAVLDLPIVNPGTPNISEYARHGLPANQFQSLFDNLVEKGYELNWLDGYSVGGKAYLNVLFGPKTGKPWKAYFGLSSSAYQAKFNQANEQGLQPVFVDTYTLNNSVKYNVIFKKVSGSYLARHGLSYEEHKEVMNEAKSKKLRPTCVAVAPVNGKRQYTVLYRSNPIGSWVIKSRVLEKDYQKLFNEQKEAGRSPLYLNAYKLGSKVYISTIFASNIPGAFKARHGMSGSSYQDQWESATGSGYRTKVVTAFDNASSQHRFAAVWRK